MNNEITILFDEAHALPKDLTMAFLTIFNTEKTNTKEFVYDDQTFIFDFTNKAIFDKWSWETVLLDGVWGGILYGLTTYLVYKLR